MGYEYMLSRNVSQKGFTSIDLALNESPVESNRPIGMKLRPDNLTPNEQG